MPGLKNVLPQKSKTQQPDAEPVTKQVPIAEEEDPLLRAWDPFYDDALMEHLHKKMETPAAAPVERDPIMAKWQAFYDLYLPQKENPPATPVDRDTSPFCVYTEGVHAMNSPYVTVSVFAEKGSYFYTYSGGTNHMDGFGNTGVIPPEYIRNHCVVLGAVLALTGSAYGYISACQCDNYLLVDFANQSVHMPKNAVCSVCGQPISAFPRSTDEPLCMNGEMFCQRCFRKENWRQILIRDYLAIGKRGDCYYYAWKGSDNIYDGNYTNRIDPSLFCGTELDIGKLLARIIEGDDGYYAEKMKKTVIPYTFDVEKRRLVGDANPCCADCGTPLSDKNIKENCVTISDLFYDTDKKPRCSRCKTNSSWAVPVYTVDGFSLKKLLGNYAQDYTIYLGILNKKPVCYVYSCYLQDGYGLVEDRHRDPILLPPKLIKGHIIEIRALLAFLKEEGKTKYLPQSYCDNYYSFDFRSRKLIAPTPFVCSQCGTALEESNIYNGMLDCTDSLCSIGKRPFCVKCFIQRRGEQAYYRRVRENMIFLFQYNIPQSKKIYYGGCDVADLYIDPKNGKTYMDLYLKQNGIKQLKIPMKELAIAAMLDRAKESAPAFYKKYQAMNNANWRDFLEALSAMEEG